MSPSRDARFTGASVVDWGETNGKVIQTDLVHTPGKGGSWESGRLSLWERTGVKKQMRKEGNHLQSHKGPLSGHLREGILEGRTVQYIS